MLVIRGDKKTKLKQPIKFLDYIDLFDKPRTYGIPVNNNCQYEATQPVEDVAKNKQIKLYISMHK